MNRRAARRWADVHQAFGSAGNVVAAISVGYIGYRFLNRYSFLFVAALLAPTASLGRAIKSNEIDPERPRCE